MGIKIFLFNLGYRGFWFALIRNPKSGPRFTKVWRQIISKGVRYFLVWSSTNLNSIWNWMILLSWVNFYPNLKKLLRGLYESASNTRVWFAFWWYFASWTCCLHPNRGLRSRMPFPGNRIFPEKIREIPGTEHSGTSSSDVDKTCLACLKKFTDTFWRTLVDFIDTSLFWFYALFIGYNYYFFWTHLRPKGLLCCEFQPVDRVVCTLVSGWNHLFGHLTFFSVTNRKK